jgi:energy-coupling factor transporter ATP-binding protein EcfA2
MNPSAPVDTTPPLFKSLTVLRRAHTNLLEEYQKYDDEQDENTLPEFFIVQVETFLHQASSSGALLDIDEDRSDAQALLNYWTTVLYSSGRTPRPTVLAKFDEDVASRQTGERCPYRGLQAFHQENRPFFYGRRQLVREMTDWLQNENFLAVVGLSGSGKSSVVRAGLIPAMQEGALPGSESWNYYDPIVPGPIPLRNLAKLTRPEDVTTRNWYRQHASQFIDDDTHLLKLVSAEGKTAVVVVDQFEELFTLSPDNAERAAFVANLVRLATDPEMRHIVIITMRSEFDTYIARFPDLQQLFERAQIRVSPLSPLDLRKAIEKPAERSGLTFEAGLVEELVQQVLGEPAGLPLLQFTLYKLWERKQGKAITWAIYRELGGSPREVLANIADATYESFKLMEDRTISRRIFMRLVQPGAGLDVTSNRVRRATLSPVAARDNFDRVLDVWEEAGLLRISRSGKPEGDQIEVMHEALIRNWPQLGIWLEEERVNQRQRLQLTSAAQQWDEHQRDPGGLLGGTLLTEALHYHNLSDLEKEFVEESQRVAKEAEMEKARHLQRVNAARKLQLRLATVFLIVALGLFGWAFRQTRKAVAASTQATEERGKATTARIEAETAEGRIYETQQAADAKFREAAAAADKKLSDLKQQTDEELGKLEVYKAKAADAKRAIAEAEAKVGKIRDEEAAKRAGLEKDLKITSIILASARPAILIENGKFEPPVGAWENVLKTHRAEIEKTVASVGRIEPGRMTAQTPEFLGTAFLIGPDVAVVPTFLTTSLPRNSREFVIDFREKSDANRDAKFAATIIGDVPVGTGDSSQSLTLLRVEKRSPGGLQLPPPLILARHPDLAEGQQLYVVGYPAHDLRNPSTVMDRILGGTYDVKRLQPGTLLSLFPAERRFAHDCFTVGGNSGSPVVDFETGLVIGLHFAGLPATDNSVGTKHAVSLWMLADNPLMKTAGVKFQ